MLIYLLKATLVWGFSLLLFELLLRKNSYHAANRFYLLLTLVAGFVMPLIEWPTQSTAPVAMPVQQTFERISTAAEPIATTGGSEGWLSRGAAYLLALYACGAGIALSRVIRDAVGLQSLRRSANVLTLLGGYTLYETSGQHGPFSFFRSIYLSSRSAYTADELEMVIVHERQHGRLLHSLDIIAMQALKITLWFHPLIHLFESRLRLVHEYEADEAAAQMPADYGRFLIEQALNTSTFSITHAFHSPIKTRIAMLTKNNRSRARALRYFLTLPLIAALVTAFSIPGYTDERKMVGNKLFYKGNEFVMSEKKSDTMTVIDAATGQEKMVITSLDPGPLSVNGEPIYEGEDVVRGAVYDGDAESASAEFFERAKPYLGKLPDGFYRLSTSSVVISKTGKLIYHTDVMVLPCMSCEPQPGEPTTNRSKEVFGLKGYYDDIAVPLREQLAKGFPFKPAELKGKPVNAFLEKDLSFAKEIVVVQNGVARMRPKP